MERIEDDAPAFDQPNELARGIREKYSKP